ncbi:MAG: PEP-CTERM sorting domain-containing protein [Armatimonadetes bacterium]|nr:PEP-CTERM sorting domain-containing protein [Armatimonadota bacterium]
MDVSAPASKRSHPLTRPASALSAFAWSAFAWSVVSGTLTLAASRQAQAQAFNFSTGTPDGKIATLSRTASAGKLETETADDFVTTAPTAITSAMFTGLLVGGATTASVKDVEIELYHVFPLDSTVPPDNRVTTRVNSPSDDNFAAADGALGQLSFTTTLLNPSFTAANSVVNGIQAAPSQFTGGEGPVTGQEVQFNVTFNTPFLLGPDHVFFRPEVDLGNAGDFLWLSAPKPILPPGTPFTPDLQSWIRNDGPGALGPDWERIGTDVTGQGPFNASFSLAGQVVPEPSSLALLAGGLLLGLAPLARRGRARRAGKEWRD